jgi:imidazole glycerol-phosphate synthase subunit HisF
MLRHRVIPIVLLDGYSVLKTIKFDVRRNLGNPITVVRIYNTRDVDELILLDIDAAKEHRKIDIFTIEDIASECFMPLTVGGGLRTCDDIAEALAHGADKVSLNTIIFEKPGILHDAVKCFGSQCIVASIDVKKDADNNYYLYSHSKTDIRLTLSEGLKLLNESEVGEILINSVDLDGTMTGYDYALIDRIAKCTKIPIIAAGGASSPKDCVKAIQSGATAAAAASIFHFTSITPMTCKQAMQEAGIPVRI